MPRLALGLFAVALVAADWPRFLGPAGDNVCTETGILTTWPAAGLTKLWDCKLGQGYAPPSIAAGRAYTFDRHGDNARLTARDAATGKELGRFEYASEYEDLFGYDPGPRAAPTVDGDRVYLQGVEGMLLCVDAKTLKERWRLDTRARYRFHQNFFGVGSAPLVEGDLVIVAVGGSPPGARPSDLRDVKPNGTCVVGVNKLTGEVKYATGDDLASYSSPTVATLGGKRRGLYFARNNLLAFDPATGTQQAKYPFRAKVEESVNAANPTIVGENVFISESYGPGSAMLAFTGDGFRELWTDAKKDRDDRALAAHWGTAVYHDGHLYGSSGRHANEADLRCFSATTGEVKWVVRRTTRCSLLKVDGHLLSLSEAGELRLFKPNPARYEEAARWESPDLDYPAWAPPVVSDGRLFVRGKDRLVAYKLK